MRTYASTGAVLASLLLLGTGIACTPSTQEGTKTGQKTDAEKADTPPKPKEYVSVFKDHSDGVVYVLASGEDQLHLFDRVTLEAAQEAVATGHEPQNLVLAPDTGFLYYVNHWMDPDDIEKSTPEGRTADGFRSHSVWGIDPAQGNRFVSKSYIGDDDEQPSPAWVSIQHEGTWLAVSEPASDTVLIRDMGEQERKRNAVIESGPDPLGSAFTKNSTFLVIANSGGDNVTVVNFTGGEGGPIVTGQVVVGQKPTFVASAGDDQHVYVSVSGGKQVAKVDCKALEVVSRFDVSGAPAGLALNSHGTALYVALSDANKVVRLEVSSGTETGSFETEAGPLHIALDEPQNRIWVTNNGASTVSIAKLEPFEFERNVHVGAAPTGLLVVTNPASAARVTISGTGDTQPATPAAAAPAPVVVQPEQPATPSDSDAADQ